MMRCYTIHAGQCSSGIAIEGGRIFVGESGRGRKLVTVPLPPGAMPREGSVLYECDGWSTSALVLIRDHSGFRGGWRLRLARTADEWDGIVRGDCPRDSMFASPEDRAKREAWLADHPERTFPPSQIVAEGYSAQGDAGRMGGGPEYLLRLDHGQAIEIVRGGRLYGAPSVVRVECVAGAVVVSDPRQDAEERSAGARWDAVADATAGYGFDS